jgi:hypothetical protein
MSRMAGERRDARASEANSSTATDVGASLAAVGLLRTVVRAGASHECDRGQERYEDREHAHERALRSNVRLAAGGHLAEDEMSRSVQQDPCVYIGQILDRADPNRRNLLKSLASRRGFEPLLVP